MTKAAYYLRVALYVGIAETGFLLANDDFREIAGKIGVLIVGMIAAAFLAVRTAIDTSAGDVAQTDREAALSPVTNIAEAAKDAVLDKAQDEIERGVMKQINKAVS